MNLIDKFIFAYSRWIPNKVIDILNLIYLLGHKTKCFWFYRNFDMFGYVTIEFHRECNRKCSYCPKSKEKTELKGTLTKEDLGRILIDLRKLNYKGAFLISGFCEPLLDPLIEKKIYFIRKKFKKNKIFVYTNGDFLNLENFNFFKKNNIKLIVSLHEPHDVNKKNKIKKIKSYYSDIQIKENMENDYLSSRGGMVEVNRKEKKIICIKPIVNLTIDCFSNIILCPDDFFSKEVLGNIKNKSIKNIWFSKRYKKVRKILGIKKSKTDLCDFCK